LALDGSALSHAALQIVRNRGFRMKPNEGDTRTSTVIFEALYGRITTRRYVDVESISSVCSIRILSTMHRLYFHGEARTPAWRLRRSFAPSTMYASTLHRAFAPLPAFCTEGRA
jgi:hypothetical protein